MARALTRKKEQQAKSPHEDVAGGSRSRDGFPLALYAFAASFIFLFFSTSSSSRRCCHLAVD